jgi:hypothetical protein
MALCVAGCSPPHRFDVSSDQPMKSIEPTFTNAKAPSVRLIDSNHAEVVANSADDSGEILVSMADGKRVTCRIGYVTNGEQEPHRLTIRNGRCHVNLPRVSDS